MEKCLQREAVVADNDSSPGATVDMKTPATARIYDHLSGGGDNFQADRDAVGKMLALVPDVKDLATGVGACVAVAEYVAARAQLLCVAALKDRATRPAAPPKWPWPQLGRGLCFRSAASATT